MIDVEITCLYCGHINVRTVYDTRSLEKETCIKCKDRNLVIKDLSKSKVDTYAGCPEFKEDSSDCNPDAGWPWNTGGD